MSTIDTFFLSINPAFVPTKPLMGKITTRDPKNAASVESINEPSFFLFSFEPLENKTFTHTLMKYFSTLSLSLALLSFLSYQETEAQSIDQEPIALGSQKSSTPTGTDSMEEGYGVRFSANRKKNHVLIIESSKSGKVLIVDESDKILYQQPIQSGANEIKLYSLKSGKYKVKVKDLEGKLYRTKLTYVKVE